MHRAIPGAETRLFRRKVPSGVSEAHLRYTAAVHGRFRIAPVAYYVSVAVVISCCCCDVMLLLLVVVVVLLLHAEVRAV